MATTQLDLLNRQEKLMKLSKVVLLASSGAESSAQHLEEKIRSRVLKEFNGGTDQEIEIISNLCDGPLKFGPRLIKQHNDGELFTHIQTNVREKDVHFLWKSRDPNLGIMELLIMGDNLNRAGVNSVTLYAPYLPYMRQDKKDDGRVPISARLIFNLLEESFAGKLKRIVSLDLHARQEQGFFSGPLDEFFAVPEFAACYKHKLKNILEEDPSKVMVVGVDAGSAKRCEYFANLLGVQYTVLDKKRTAHGVAAHTYHSDVKLEGVTVILPDDIIDSAGSMVGEYEKDKTGPVQYLKERGATVLLCATHALFSSKNGITAEERLAREQVPVLVTDSLPEKYPGYYLKHDPWLDVLSVDYLLAKAFYCNQTGASISDFLKRRETELRSDKLDIVQPTRADYRVLELDQKKDK